jgi:hypothetical protein
LVDGCGGLGRMRGSMDVVDAEWLQGNYEVAIVGLKKDVLFSESTNIILYRESVSWTWLNRELQLASINNPVNGVVIVAALQIRY